MAKYFKIVFKQILNFELFNSIFNLLIRVFFYLNIFEISIWLFRVTDQKYSKLYLFGLFAIDMLLKVNNYKLGLSAKALLLKYRGKLFINFINILIDIFSFRNLILPFILFVLIKFQSFANMEVFQFSFLASTVHSLIGRIRNRIHRFILLTICILVYAFALYHNAINISIPTVLLLIVLVFLLFYRLKNKTYRKEPSKLALVFKDFSKFSLNSKFLNLDLKAIIRSRYLKSTYFKIVVLDLIYAFLINNSSVISENSFIAVFTIYFLFPVLLLVPNMVSSEYKYLALLLQKNQMASYFKYQYSKLQILTLFQLFPLGVVTLVKGNIGYLPTFLLVSIFFSFFVIPLFLMSVLFVESRVEVFDRDKKSFFDTPPTTQSLFFLFLIISVILFLFLLKFTVSESFYFGILLLLSLVGHLSVDYYVGKLSFWFNKRKYKIYNRLRKND